MSLYQSSTTAKSIYRNHFEHKSHSIWSGTLAAITYIAYMCVDKCLYTQIYICTLKYRSTECWQSNENEPDNNIHHNNIYIYTTTYYYVYIRTRVCALKSYGIAICSAMMCLVDVMGYGIIMCIIIIIIIRLSGGRWDLSTISVDTFGSTNTIDNSESVFGCLVFGMCLKWELNLWW